jgi:hypothetical protein
MDSEQEKSAAGADGQPMAATGLEKLFAECPTHGTVSMVCPRCAGKVGGKAHRGTRSRRKKELKALEDARRVLDVHPEAKMLENMAEDRKRFQALADRLGWTRQERELWFTRMFLADGVRHLGELSDGMGLPPEERAKLREDMQESVALALGSE